MNALLPSQILDAAAAKIEPEGAWTQSSWARNSKGHNLTYGYERGAVCWCVDGALEAVLGKRDAHKRFAARRFLLRAIRKAELFRWHDDPGRKQTTVVRALRKAADLARERGE